MDLYILSKITQKYFLFTLPFCIHFSTWAACDPNGNITGANGSIILGSPGCSDGAGNVNATVTTGSTITTAGDGITGPVDVGHNPWNITNQTGASINAGGSGIVVQDGGDTITNQIGASIVSASNGIVSTGNVPAITLNNAGIIQSTNLSGGLLLGGATVTNTGTIEGAFLGLSISANGPNPSGGPSSVDNYGTIQSTSGFNTGILLGLGGTITNRSGALIDGFLAVGTSTNTSTVNNMGTIGDLTGFSSTSVGLGAGGTVNNSSTGQLISGSRGVSVDGGPGIVNNSGLIKASVGRGIDFGVTSTGGTVNNYATGTISGGGTRSIVFEGGAGTVNNQGTVSGGSIAAIEMEIANSVINNSGTINGNVLYLQSNDQFTMTAGQMTGNLNMGTLGNETALFKNVTDANIGTIAVFNGGGGGHDQLIFNNSTHTGGSDIVNWETVSLQNNATLTLNNNLVLGGTSADLTANLNINSATLHLNSGTTEKITANTVPVLVNNAGIINLASTQANTSLIIQGQYTGQNGTLNLNSALNADNSPADKLVIDGQHTSGNANGSTNMTVNNTTGVGALTTSNGILVVEAINNATTNTDAFTLNGPIRVGAYDYRLFRSGLNPSDPSTEQDWFLRSTFVPTPAPSNLLPILGPELSVYATASPAAINLFRLMVGTFDERIQSQMTSDTNNSFFNSPFTFAPYHIQNTSSLVKNTWLRVFGESFRENYASFARPSSSGHASGVQAGIDTYHDESEDGSLTVFGLFGAYASTKQDIHGKVTNPTATAYLRERTGDLNLDATSFGLYWTYRWAEGRYLDLVAQGSALDGHSRSTRTERDLHGRGSALSAETGYPIQFTRNWYFEPEVQLLDFYTEFDHDDDDFSRADIKASHAVIGRAGARILYNKEGENFSAQPYVRANIWSVLSGNNANVTYAQFQTIPASAKTNWAQIGVGLNLLITKHLGAYAFFDDLVDFQARHHRSVKGVDGGIGVRMIW